MRFSVQILMVGIGALLVNWLIDTPLLMVACLLGLWGLMVLIDKGLDEDRSAGVGSLDTDMLRMKSASTTGTVSTGGNGDGQDGACKADIDDDCDYDID